MSLFEPNYEESIAYLLVFVQRHNPKAAVNLPDFPNSIYHDIRLVKKLIRLAYELNKTYMSDKVDYAIAAIELEWDDNSWLV